MSKLKKMPDINQKLFLQLETADGALLKEIGKREDTQTGEIDDLGIEFDYSEVKKEEGSGEKKDDGPYDSDKEVDIDDI